MLIQDKLKLHWNILPKGWRFFIVTVLIIGIFFRFFNLEKKLFWVDETDSLLRISGHTRSEVLQQVYDGQIINVEELQKNYQQISSEKNFISTFKSLTKDVHPPLYFMMGRFWMLLLGGSVTSVTAIRSFSAFLSILVFPCLYWLCTELFGSQVIGWTAVIVVAVSPFHVLYAQEARMYSLWTVLILLSSAALLRAIRLNTKFSWFIYSLTIAFSLYTHLFSILVAIGHGVYTLIIEKFRLSQKLVSYLIFSLLALFIYLPWILVIFLNWKSFTGASSWIQEKGFNLGSFLTITNNIIHSFIDFWYAYTYLPNLTFPHLRFAILIKPILVILIAYSVYFLYRSTKREVWLFVLTLLGTTPLLLILKDLATGSGSSGVSRYIIPCYLGIQISVAYLFTNRLSCTYLSSWQRRAWQIVIFLLISGGILSSFVSSQAETWSTKYYRNQHQLAKIINQATNPLVISDSSPNSVFSLAHHLDSKVQLELLVSPNQLQIPSSFSDVFLFETSEKLRQSLKEREDYQVVSVKKIINLWQLKKY